MEYSFPPRKRESSTQSDNREDIKNQSNNDLFGDIFEMMNFEGYAGWCSSPSATEQLMASYGFGAIGSHEQLNFSEQQNDPFGSPLSFADKIMFPNSVVCSGDYDSASKQDNMVLVRQGRVPKPLSHSLSERMLHALSLLKESSGGGILAQMWVPIKSGDQKILSTCEQPYLLDQTLLGYREISRSYTFSAEEKPGTFPGLPGRVFISKIPEWTSNISYYSSAEYLRVQHARDHDVRGSVAIPIFSPDDGSCCAVLELVTMKEKPNFDSEIESVCRALEAVDLKSTQPPRLPSQHGSLNRKSALAEITDVLRVVCHSHQLPLALTWIPCTVEEEDGENVIRMQNGESGLNLNKKSILCIDEGSCYVTDKEIQGFVHVCSEHPLEEGHGVAGKALQSNIPFFFSDVKNYHINEYPLVQHARKYGLCAAVAIRLRSTYTGNDDYILEFFLPLNMKGNKEQQLLLDSLSGTMQRICKSLRTVGDAELVSSSEVENRGMAQSFFPRDTPIISTQQMFVHANSKDIEQMSLQMTRGRVDSIDGHCSSEKASGSRRPTEKKRSVAEKTVSLSVLQQYFSGSLKDAAKSIGVCPTTLKRICRQHGISRWPSRKINKVNRSLRKIQTVLDSVEGVEGGLKFDPTTGELVAVGSAIQEFDPCKNLIMQNKSTLGKPYPLERAGEVSSQPTLLKPTDEQNSHPLSDSIEDLGKSGFEVSEFGNMFRHFGSSHDNMDIGLEHEDGIVEHHQASSSNMTESSNASGSSMSPKSNEKRTNEDGGSRITVKVSFKEDTIRFKFDRSTGCLRLYEEVATRFKLQLGSFQLNYLDDEDEWVMLVSDADLQECLEIMDFFGKHNVKFLVRDMVHGMESSGSSNSFLVRS